MATYTDNFNRTDSSSLGSPWVQLLGSPESYGTFTNRCSNYRVTGSAYVPTLYDNTVGNDQYSKATIYATTNQAYPAVAVRMSSTGGYTGYTLFILLSGAGWDLNKRVSGTYSSILTGSDTLVANDVIELRAVGTTISVYNNGVLLDSVTDASIASGQVGLDMYSAPSADVSLWDDWEGGDITGGGGSTAHIPAYLQMLRSNS